MEKLASRAGRHQSWLRLTINRLGVAWSVMFVTLVSVGFSLMAGALLGLWLKSDIVLLDMALFVTVPALLVPLITHSMIRLVYQLDASEQELRSLVMVDALTGLSTRRHFMDLAQWAWGQAQRHGQPLSLLMVGLDHFKAINDGFGHDMGDRVLAEFGKIAQSVCRNADLAGRYGGEEFVFLLPHATAGTALVFAERLRSSVESRVAPALGLKQRVTVSIGIATLVSPKDGMSLPVLIKQADAAMYVAKSAGRNCLRSYGQLHTLAATAA